MIESNTSKVVAAFKTLIDEIEVEINLTIEHANRVKACHDKLLSLYKEYQILDGTQKDKTGEQVILLNGQDYEPEIVTYKKPTGASILGSSFLVSSWTDLLVQTLNIIIKLHPAKFAQIIDQLPTLLQRSNRMKPLLNGRYVNVNFSAPVTLKHCSDILEMVGASTKDSVIVIDDERAKRRANNKNKQSAAKK